MSSQVMAEAAAAGCSEAAAELATEDAAALLAALLEQPDSAPAAAAPRALRADARMKFLREILFIVRNPFFSLLVFFSQNILLHRAQFDVFLTIFIIVKSLPKEKDLEEYKELYFSIIHDEIYHVRDDFPRIISKPNGIVDLTYKINLEKCKDYIVVDVIEKIRGKLK